MGSDTKVNVTIEFFSKALPLDEVRTQMVKDILKEFEINPQGFSIAEGEIWFEFYCNNNPDYKFLDKIRDTLTLGATRITTNEWVCTEEGYYYDIEDAQEE